MVRKDTAVHNVTQENINKKIKHSPYRIEQFQKNLLIKLNELNRKEKEFYIFKLIFDGLTYDEKITLIEVLTKTSDNMWGIINIANDVRKNSENAIYVRNECCMEIMDTYKSLLNKMTKLAEELDINNSLELSILFSYLLWNGYLSKTKKHEFKETDQDEIYGLLFANITNGMGVCRNYSEMLKDFLLNCGYPSIVLENYFGKVKTDYIMDIAGRKAYAPSSPQENIRKKKKANHVFNLIEDNGLYIYDPTNLLLFNFENKDTATLINGKGKNIIYPYNSYDFCYSKDDERFLDRIFTGDVSSAPYTRADFISTSEVNIELIRNSTSLLEDFYKEAKPDILGISEETKKILTRKR